MDPRDVLQGVQSVSQEIPWVNLLLGELPPTDLSRERGSSRQICGLVACQKKGVEQEIKAIHFTLREEEKGVGPQKQPMRDLRREKNPEKWKPGGQCGC